jgi:hypothetical protein
LETKNSHRKALSRAERPIPMRRLQFKVSN